ncbi:Hypothetical predicted protein [Paramuricea clavata]|uniref:Uncharacterized protein n=1 Tax=Paramuricea clavata TaxID=317549 RepID=A0A6S7HSY1_PARCT|nr:Hypothetical predicted protein [Paramuricea clavata]
MAINLRSHLSEKANRHELKLSRQMGYITNGDCQSILNDALNLELENSTILVGSIDVKPLAVAVCRFTKSKLCQSDNSIVEDRGWRYVEDLLNNGGECQSF